ncbi:LacI family DNA-binding transcriptional regulator [Isoptericola sp. BMS4]|uniref:LacI family DNA-binding transcriptional regulator n=1 Tax=Isoptericola sp. BMS4 TaxID=2527875 RepID=UPI001423C155|nr:LacI family DNA-binding transcriptional regulator [Isoptericola sp. BMS4]
MTRSGGGAATILDVARAAGVSRTTVSRVLNDPHHVSPDTLKRVRDAADALQYSPSGAARGLRGGRTGLVALLVGDIAQPFHGALAKAVVAAAENRGLGVVLHDLGHRTDRLESILRKLPRQQVDGVVIATADSLANGPVVAAVEDCLRHGTAVVTGVEQLDVPGVVSLRSGHDTGARLAAEALAAEGFDRPALLLGDRTGPFARQLAAGAPAADVLETGYDFDGAARATRDLPAHVDSLLVATLPMALGASAGLADAGRELPVVVCEDVPLAAQLRPAFTTSAITPESTGEEMIRLLDATVRGEPVTPTRLTARLVRRDTF